MRKPLTKEAKDRKNARERKRRFELGPQEKAHVASVSKAWRTGRSDEQKQKDRAKRRKKHESMPPEERQKENDRKRAQQALKTEDQRRQDMCNRCEERANRKKIPFNLTLDHINAIWPKDNQCPALGVLLERGTKHVKRCSPTIDKLNPALGYVIGNVAIVSHLANAVMQDATPTQVMAVASWFKNQVNDWE